MYCGALNDDTFFVADMAENISIFWPIPKVVIYMDFLTEVSGTTYVNNACRTNHIIWTIVIFILSWEKKSFGVQQDGLSCSAQAV